MTKTATRTPEEILESLAPAYKEWKGGEKEKNKLKDEFFDAITEKVSGEELNEEIVLAEDAKDITEGREYVEKRYPFYEVTDARKNPDGEGWEYIIRERPEFKTFYIDYDGYTYGRQVATGPTLVDEEEILEKDLEFYIEITEWENQKLLSEVIAYCCDLNDEVERWEALTGYCTDNDIPRVLKPITDLSPDELAKLQQYSYEGKPVTKLPAPKKVKE